MPLGVFEGASGAGGGRGRLAGLRVPVSGVASVLSASFTVGPTSPDFLVRFAVSMSCGANLRRGFVTDCGGPSICGEA